MKTIFFCLTLATCRLYAQHQDTLALRYSQHQDTLTLRHLPPDADAIYRFNLPVITSKLAWQELADRIPLPQQNTSARELAAILKEPFRAGVDPDGDIFWTDMTAPTPGLTVNPASNPARGTPPTDTLHTCSLLLHLADSGRFVAFLRDLEPGIRINSQDSARSAGRNGMAAAWNKSLLVLTFITPLHPALSHSHHTTLAIRQSLTMLRGYPDTCRILDPLFLQGFTDDADIDAWTVPGKISSLLGQFLLRLDYIPDYLRLSLPDGEKIRVLTTLRFEKGQVTVKSITPLPPGAANAWARLIARYPASDRINPDSSFNPGPTTGSTPYPSNPAPDRPLALLSLHINPLAIGDLLDSLHARGRAEAMLFDKGLSLENFVHAFQGDLLLTVIAPDSTHSYSPVHGILTASTPVLPDHNAVAENFVGPASPRPSSSVPSGYIGRSASSPRTNPDHPSLYAAIPLQDLTAFRQWMGCLKWLTASPDDQDSGHGNTLTTIGRLIPAWLVKDNCLIIAPDSRSADPPAAAANTDAPLTLRINLKKMAIAGHTLDQLLFTAGRLNSNNQIENVLQLTLADPSRNSLRILFRLLE